MILLVADWRAIFAAMAVQGVIIRQLGLFPPARKPRPGKSPADPPAPDCQ